MTIENKIKKCKKNQHNFWVLAATELNNLKLIPTMGNIKKISKDLAYEIRVLGNISFALTWIKLEMTYQNAGLFSNYK